MLELKSIKKSYTVGTFTQDALNDFSLKFRKNEFVAVLGHSGSGKTTLLNIIGGLDRYDSGDLIINNKSTKKFKNVEWDAYRNNCIGFIFQSYNLITHISVLANVELAMTLSGISKSKRRKKAMEALNEVGLVDHAYKKPNQLSGGQMQRVAIARALVNDPDVILADEPTGAIDSKTSVQIMELIKKIAKNKLVIMVTHNSEIANKYATRIVQLKDGELISDSNPIKDKEKDNKEYNIKKTSMGFLTALSLSFNNIRTKKGRTFLTAFAASIGIIGIALILSLSNGLQKQIDEFERGSLSQMPIFISSQAMQLDEAAIERMHNDHRPSEDDYTDEQKIFPLPSMRDQMTHTNNITEEYIDHINSIDQDLISGISFMRSTGLNIIGRRDTGYAPLGLNPFEFTVIPEKTDDNRWELAEYFYDVITGRLPENKNELILLVDFRNRVNESILEALGFADLESISFEDILNVELRLIANDDFFQQMGIVYIPNTDFESLFHGSDNTLRIVGIARGKEEYRLMVGESSGLVYTEDLMQFVYEQNKDSRIVRAQMESNHNIMTGAAFTPGEEGELEKEQIITRLGGNLIPFIIQVFPRDFNSKELVLEHLDEFNVDLEEEEKIVYTDMAALITGLSANFMNGVTYVLIGFSSISLLVSSIMIGIITYISVLERTKEIGILRAIGARKKDVTRVFNAETFIIGVASGLIGIAIAYGLTFPISALIYNWTDLRNVAQLNPTHALILIIVSLTLTLIGGFIPSKLAAKKDPVIALRAE